MQKIVIERTVMKISRPCKASMYAIVSSSNRSTRVRRRSRSTNLRNCLGGLLIYFPAELGTGRAHQTIEVNWYQLSTISGFPVEAIRFLLALLAISVANVNIPI